MGMKWLTPLVAALFIATNVGTFMIVKNKVKVVEKLVTVYKSDNSKAELSTNENRDKITSDVDKKLANKTKVKGVENYSYGFDDSDYSFINEKYYFVNDEKIQEADADTTNENEATDNPDNSLETTVVGIPYFKPTDNTGNTSHKQYEVNDIIEEEAAEEYPYVADEDIPIPQLPLCDTDFEIDVNDGGIENVLLPQLPDDA